MNLSLLVFKHALLAAGIKLYSVSLLLLTHSMVQNRNAMGIFFSFCKHPEVWYRMANSFIMKMLFFLLLAVLFSVHSGYNLFTVPWPCTGVRHQFTNRQLGSDEWHVVGVAQRALFSHIIFGVCVSVSVTRWLIEVKKKCHVCEVNKNRPEQREEQYLKHKTYFNWQSLLPVV